MKIAVTGSAGFIGQALALKLLARGYDVAGFDNHNDYYEPTLKDARVKPLIAHHRYRHTRADLADGAAVDVWLERERPEVIVHLAAQAGVRYSLVNPNPYIQSNLVGFANVLEACRRHPVRHLLYASSSSVYGANAKLPFSVDDRVDQPLSLYAATKRANELMAQTYQHLYGMSCTGFRFFTVYGPWGRPDMAYFSFTRRILAGEALELFDSGRYRRDFTYIDDIVDGLLRAVEAKPPTQHALYNLGDSRPVELIYMVELLEQLLGRKARVLHRPVAPGDPQATCADIEATRRAFGFDPRIRLEQGLAEFVDWYRDYYGVRRAA